MLIYKFRPLGTKNDFDRVKKILETGNFWCSKFSELNDPMEGAFHSSIIKKVNEAFEEKMSYKICSFSGKEAFKDPTLWGYYSNGFRGIVIEVECDDADVKKVNYIKDIQSIDENTVDEILVTKLEPWKREKEYRFLKKLDTNLNKIGQIKTVYFGSPYDRSVNRDGIYTATPMLNNYKDFKKNLISIIENTKIEWHNVEIEKNNVIKSKKQKI